MRNPLDLVAVVADEDGAVPRDHVISDELLEKDVHGPSLVDD